jgi:L-ascorbate metabolism protein UlaG (beta-lactamase superfamily)
VDVYDPEKLSRPVGAADILLTTHTHWDHYNPEFQTAFPGEQLFLQAGSLEFQGSNIQGLASAHNAGDRLKSEGGTNYIYVIEIGEMRIAHFGDIGQNTLTDEQLNTLGRIDIALTQLNNPFSDMSAENRKGINLMEQLQPRLVIPTHLNLETVKLAIAQWAGFYTEKPSLRICETDFSENGTQILLMGEAAGTMLKYIELVEWEYR